MDQRDHRTQAEAKVKTEPDINSDHDGCRNDGPRAFLAQLASDLRPDRLNSVNFEGAATELACELLLNLFAELAKLSRSSLKPHEEFVGALLTKILDHRVAGAEFAQRVTNLSDGYRLRKLQLRHGSASEIDAQQWT